MKMLTMSLNKKTETFSYFVNHLHIVPVSISYEYDPCDGAKARELYEKEHQGGYEKLEHEDVASIALGISGNKGNVHVSFGEPLNGEFADADAAAAAVDKQVINNYVLHPTNFFAYKMLHGEYPKGVYSRDNIPFNIENLKQEESAFHAHIAALPHVHKDYVLGIYANSIISKQRSNA